MSVENIRNRLNELRNTKIMKNKNKTKLAAHSTSEQQQSQSESLKKRLIKRSYVESKVAEFKSNKEKKIKLKEIKQNQSNKNDENQSNESDENDKFNENDENESNENESDENDENDENESDESSFYESKDNDDDDSFIVDDNTESEDEIEQKKIQHKKRKISKIIQDDSSEEQSLEDFVVKDDEKHETDSIDYELEIEIKRDANQKIFSLEDEITTNSFEKKRKMLDIKKARQQMLNFNNAQGKKGIENLLKMFLRGEEEMDNFLACFDNMLLNETFFSFCSTANQRTIVSAAFYNAWTCNKLLSKGEKGNCYLCDRMRCRNEYELITKYNNRIGFIGIKFLK